MRSLLKSCILYLLGLLGVMGLLGCKESNGDERRKEIPWGTEPPEFRSYLTHWNKKIHSKLLKKQRSLAHEIEKLTHQIDQEDKESIKKILFRKKKTLIDQQNTVQNRLNDGDYFQFKPAQKIPQTLNWENGLENPDIGDPKAKKGGTITLWEPVSYPDTFRLFGPNSNTSIRARLYDEVQLQAVGLHPVTGKIIPGVCSEWAVSADGRTVFYRLDPEARYSDGAPVKARDFMVTVYVRTADYAKSTFDQEFFQEEISNITVYDDRTFSVTLPEPIPLMPFKANLYPTAPHFYAEYGPDFAERYQWKVEPTTGGYTLLPGNFIRGQQVTISRVQDWWAKDKKFYRNACNVDHITFRFITEESKGLELFRSGQIDINLMNKPDLWHEKMEIPEVHQGYIERATFYTIYPRYPVGLFLNMGRPPFDNQDIRLGFQHAINMQRVADVIYRGDYQRIDSFCSGYGRFTNSHIKAREYSPEKAREYFAKAGYTQSGNDGILRNAQGEKLKAEVTYANTNPTIKATMSILKEDAKKAGIDLRLDDLDPNVSFRKVIEKRHQCTFWAWGFTPPHPKTHQYLHSTFAYDEKGNLLENTNNITSTADDILDQAVEAERKARNEDELEKASHNVQQRVHDLAFWIPGSNAEFSRLGYWRWVKWPQSETTQFCHPLIFDPCESHLYWIDEEEKKNTLKAKQQGESFEEKDLIFDQYRRTATTSAP